MKVVGYIRVSDDKLKSDGDRRQDINRQKEKIILFCKNMEWNEPSFFIDDGVSAYKEDYQSRPEFCRLLREVRANRVQRIVVEDLTRWSRRLEDGVKTLKEVSEKATVTSMAEGELYVTEPDGWFRSSLAFLMAEWASRIMSHKIKSGMARRIDNPKAKCSACGNVHLGRIPNKCKEVYK